MKNIFLFITLFTSTISFAQTDTSKSTEAPLTIAEQMPSFPGGELEMMKFIQRNVIYPHGETMAGVSGTCYISFVVDKDGTIKNVKVLRGVRNGPGIDREAMRVVNLMPKWEPGKQNGKEVSVLYNLPIKFTQKSPLASLTFEQEQTSVSTYYYNNGLELAKTGAFEKAIEEFDLALKLFPKDADALYNKGYMYYKLDKNEEACKVWNYLKSTGSKLADEMISKNCK